MKLTYSSDHLLSGGSIFSDINKRLKLSANYINLFEVASSGTKNISVRNPVYDISLIHHFDNEKYRLNKLYKQVFLKDIGCTLN